MTEKNKIFMSFLLFLGLFLFISGIFQFVVQRIVQPSSSEIMLLIGATSGIFFFVFITLLFKWVYRRKIDWNSVLLVSILSFGIGFILSIIFYFV